MGQPFRGIGTDGFDNARRTFVSTWIDTAGTMMLVMEGAPGPDPKVRTMWGQYQDPESGELVKVKSVTTIVSDTEYRYESWRGPTKDEMIKSMEIVYKR
jgi:hypothetical protein